MKALGLAFSIVSIEEKKRTDAGPSTPLVYASLRMTGLGLVKDELLVELEFPFQPVVELFEGKADSQEELAE
jgi:hypothetical protein